MSTQLRTPSARDRFAGPTAAGIALVLVALSASASTAQRSYDPAAPELIRTGSNPPGDAFIFKAEDGFNDEHYQISNYEIRQPWIDAGFSPKNARFDDSELLLSLSPRRYRSRRYTAAEFQKNGFYGFGRYEVIMKGVAGDGIISSFFTHTHDQFDDPHDEIDIELLGRNTRQIHLNHFRDGEPGDAVKVDLPFDFSEEFHLYGFEWAPDSIKWFVDGRQVHEVRDDIPIAPGRVIAQIWVGGRGAWTWTGRPKAVKGAAAYRCFSHVPMGQSGSQCSDTFSLSPGLPQ